MFQPVSVLLGVTGAAVLLVNLAHSALDGPSPAARPAFQSSTSVNTSSKSDRPMPARPAQDVSAVSSVELVGVTNTTVILRDRMGNVLYRSDALTNTTVVSKNADIPTVTVKQAADSPVVQKPAPAKQIESKEERKGRTGCEGVVSALANPDLGRVPGLCLA